MIERALSRTDIRTLLDRLSERLREKRAFAKLHVVGSACIALAYERERTTLDIDVRVDAGHRALEDAIREIAQEHGLPPRWLNDQARGFIPERDDPRSPTLYESQSLVVTGASGEYLLAMKLEASREKDTQDVRYLLQRRRFRQIHVRSRESGEHVSSARAPRTGRTALRPVSSARRETPPCRSWR